jgi:hypothetical protein
VYGLVVTDDGRLVADQLEGDEKAAAEALARECSARWKGCPRNKPIRKRAKRK